MTGTLYAVLGDVHSNWEALNAVLRDAQVQGVSRYVCVGDIVGYNADPVRCLDAVRDLNCLTVRGNHDHCCSHDQRLNDFHPLAANVIDWTRGQLSEAQIQYLKGLRLTRVTSGFTLVHSTLDMPEKWGYVFDTLEAEAHFNYQTTSLCFCGHTHVPVIYEKYAGATRHVTADARLAVGRKYFVNVGSVGQPRDGNPRASYVLYDSDRKTVQFRRVEYDVRATQDKIRRAGLPERLALRLEAGR
jgi:diadenosine tetraphosphatase ApaH/serine/threonine PP2A family protein phosphatase